MDPNSPLPPTTLSPVPSPVPVSSVIPPQPVPAPVAPVQNPGETNTSGMGDSSVVPEEVKGFSWGAFLWTWIWAIGNKVWIGLLALLPLGPLPLIMAIILGIKGREWAWQKKHWDSVEAFKKTQKAWVKWWFIIMIPLGIIFAILGIVFATILVKSTPFLIMQGTNDDSMRSDVLDLGIASEKYENTNNMFPWDTTADDFKMPYSSMDAAHESWMNTLVSSGELSQTKADKFAGSNYKIAVYEAPSSDNSTINQYYCFQPISTAGKTEAAASCKTVQDPTIQGLFCKPGNEYICEPDLSPTPQASP
jgi:hypothetical protein